MPREILILKLSWVLIQRYVDFRGEPLPREGRINFQGVSLAETHRKPDRFASD
jgi:hypothetical protein